MKKKLTRISGIGLVVIMLAVLLLSAVPVSAGSSDKDFDARVSDGQYDLVTKDVFGPDGIRHGDPGDSWDATWAILQQGQNPWGKVKFEIADNTLTADLKAFKLEPGNWYFVEIVDKGSDGNSWNDLSEDEYSKFYGQADRNGKIAMSFDIDLPSGAYVEINMKNAPIRALNDPSEYGDMTQWELTGQGDNTDWRDWYGVLYGATTIPVP